MNAGSSMDTGATAMRRVFFGDSSVDAALKVMAPYVHPAVLDYLRAWSALPDYQARRGWKRMSCRRSRGTTMPRRRYGGRSAA